ncbi:MAG: hypothetical protein JNM42_00620 [Propionivibrio sp.]|uniref:hypothetical protein n=1 Tax=Propionivibrio sp. TaxID=2212460 RepID=UPI001A5F4D8A|nr:hypothetical protein [Propionivibrio sp.]MBL8412924.1 hypothetical protein [Propionivibrio sp.]
MAAGWVAALAIYLFLLRPYGVIPPKGALWDFGIVPAIVFIAVLIITLLIRPIYSSLGFGSLERLDESTYSTPSSRMAKFIFKIYGTLGLICIAMAAYCQLIFSVIFFSTNIGAL